jgi:hypothetical protein
VRGFALVMLALTAGVACTSAAPHLTAEPWPEANALFTRDSSWIGGDGAYSVDLGGGRVLWLFGDSFVATSPARRRDESYMVRNSVALQTGYDPTRAFMRFYYRQVDGHPASFVPEDGGFWLWPGHGIRRGDRALLFYGRVYQASEGMWGFASGSWTAFLVENPDEEPSAWRMSEATVAPQVGDVGLGGAVFELGEHLYVYGNGGDFHAIYLARFATERAMAGDLTAPEWWTGSGYGDVSKREPVLAIGAPEYSVHYAAPLGRYVLTETEGFGASTLAIRTAPAPEGPWSDPTDVLRPPESFAQDPFVYAGKAHPELRGAELAATYVPSGFEDSPPDPGELLYYPRFLRIGYR